MQIFNVKSKEEITSINEKLIREYTDNIIVYRGQLSDRSMLPSIFRGGNRNTIGFPGCIPTLTANWSLLAERLVTEFRKGISSWLETQAIMQHYGYRSILIDVTSDLNIALWFALHKFESSQSPFFVGDRLKSAVFQWARYESSKTGYLYFLKLPKGDCKRFIDLTSVMPTVAERIHRQKAGGIICTKEQRTADDLVIAKIALNDDGWFKGSNIDLPVSELFPLPSTDSFYQRLCTIPYYITPERFDKKIQIGHPLLGMFPIYAQSIKEILKEYTPLTTILQTKPSLKWSIASGAFDCDNIRLKARSADRISISKLLVDLITKDKIRVNNLSGLPSQNLIFEFEPEGALFITSTRALERAVLGIWVVFSDKTLKFTEIVDNFDEVYFDNTSSYSLTEEKWINKTGSNNDYYLQMLGAISALLVTKILEIKTVDKNYKRISYTNRIK